MKTPVLFPMAGDYTNNNLYIKREDMIPFALEGIKREKAAEFTGKLRHRMPASL